MKSKNYTLLILSFVFLSNLFNVLSSFGQVVPPDSPTGVTASQTGITNVVVVNWTASVTPIFDGYKITYVDNSAISQNIIVASNAVTATLSNLTYNATYGITIESFILDTSVTPTDSVFSTPTSPVSVTVVGLVAPTINSDFSTPYTIGINIIDTNPSESGFELEYSDGSTTLTSTAPAGSNVATVLSNLNPKTTYSVKARAYYGTNYGPWSNTITPTTLKDIPPAASMTVTYNCPTVVSFGWTIATRSEDIEGFKLQKSVDGSGFYDYSNLLPPGTNTHYDGAPTPGRTFYYRVVSINSTGIALSNVVQVTVNNYTAPSAPINLASNQYEKTVNSLTFNWTNAAEDLSCDRNKRSSIYIYIKVNNGPSQLYKIIGPNETTVKIEGLSPNDLVEIEVKPIGTTGIGGGSRTATDKTLGPPNFPDNLVVTPLVDALGYSYLKLNWRDNAYNEDYFVIEANKDDNGFKEIARIVKNSTEFKNVQVEEGVSYTYRIKGVNSYGSSVWSTAVASVAPYSAAPEQPSNLKVTASGSSVTLTWSDNTLKETNYVVEKSTDKGATYTTLATLARNSMTYTDANNGAGLSFYYRVKASNSKGSSLYSNAAMVKISGSASLLPDNVSVYPNPTVNSISVAVPDNEARYLVEIMDQKNNTLQSKTTNADNSNEISINTSNLVPGVYYIKISNDVSSLVKRIVKY